MRSVPTTLAVVGVTLLVGVARGAPAPLVLYSAQHEQMVDALAAAFTKATGIPVRIHQGEAPEIASQIVREGADSPADVFFTENSPELVLLDEKHLLATLPASVTAAVPRRDSAPDGSWVGVFARENVLAFNPTMIGEGALPASLLDLAEPAWKGRVAIAPTDADFLPLVEAVVLTHGRPAALAWLRGLKVNAAVFDDDEGVVAAVERGSVAAGIINSYYWARLRQEVGPAKTVSRIHHFGGHDVGALINVSGAGVVAASGHRDEADRFVAFLVSRDTEAAIGAGDVDFEYPLAPGVAANPLLAPMATLQPPPLPPASCPRSGQCQPQQPSTPPWPPSPPPSPAAWQVASEL